LRVIIKCKTTLFNLLLLLLLLLKPQHAPLQSVILHAIISYISVASVHLHLFVRTIYLFKVHREHH